MTSLLFRAAGLLVVCIWLAASPVAADGPPPPSNKDKCPVCGMFAYKYPDWLAVASLGGRHYYFDGAKDMFKFLLDPAKYAQGATGAAVDVFVTDYYSLELVPAREAWYVIGSDVFGPMGAELVPFASRQDADTFLVDHHGRSVVSFDQVTPDVVKSLDARQ